MRTWIASNGRCYDQGRGLPDFGRWEDHLSLGSDSSIQTIDHNRGVSNRARGFDTIVVKVVPSSRFTEADEDALIHGLQERLGDDVSISVELVDRVQRTSSGKFKWVISRVSLGI